MNAFKLVAIALTVMCGVSSTTAAGSTSGSVGSASLLELVNEAKAAVASNPDLAALFANLPDLSKLSEAQLTNLVKEILAVTDSSGSGSSSAGVTAGSSSTSKVVTTAPSASTTTTSAPVVTPKSAASALTLAPAAAITLVASVVYTLL